jgi:hypothetical protein
VSYAPPPPPPAPGQQPMPTPIPAPGATPPASRGASPWLFVVIGLLIGAIIGFAAGYALRGASSSSAPAATSSPTAAASASPSATATPARPTATQPALPTPQTVTGLSPTRIDQSGTGDGQVPTGATFMINPTWAISLAWSCPPGSAGSAGQGTVIRVAVQPGTPGLSTGDTTETDGAGDAGSRVNFENDGGNFILKVTPANPACQWHIVVYGKTA